MKVLWVIGGGVESIPGILTAQNLGIYVVVSDLNPNAPAKECANFFLVADTYSPIQTIEAASSFVSPTGKIDGVIAFAADVPQTLAAFSAKFGLVGQSEQTARLASNKVLMKNALKSAGISIPWFHPIESHDSLAVTLERRHGKHILKPVDSRGSRGVIQVLPESDLKAAFDYSISFSPSRKLILEEFLTGPQVSTESIMHSGVGWNIGLADRNYSQIERWYPSVIEDGGSQPSILSQKIQKSIFKEVTAGAHALGLVEGTYKGDMVWHNGRAYVIEIATRLSGGWFSSIQIPYSTSVPFLELAIRQALNEELPGFGRKITKRKAVAIRYLFSDTGKSFENNGGFIPPKSRFLLKSEISFEGKSSGEPPKSHVDRLGFVIARGFSRKHAIRQAERLVRQIKSQLAIE
jgi:biotin carboxylase